MWYLCWFPWLDDFEDYLIGFASYLRLSEYSVLSPIRQPSLSAHDWQISLFPLCPHGFVVTHWSQEMSHGVLVRVHYQFKVCLIVTKTYPNPHIYVHVLTVKPTGRNEITLCVAIEFIYRIHLKWHFSIMTSFLGYLWVKSPSIILSPHMARNLVQNYRIFDASEMAKQWCSLNPNLSPMLWSGFVATLYHI